jgi:hypothetical protein
LVTDFLASQVGRWWFQRLASGSRGAETGMKNAGQGVEMCVFTLSGITPADNSLSSAPNKIYPL